MRDAAPHREYQRSTQLAYFFFLALFPALLCLLAIASFFPLQNFTDEVGRVLGPFAPREMIDVIRQQMNAEIEHVSPWGKAPGEKVPGTRKKIGLAAARVYRANEGIPRAPFPIVRPKSS